MNSVRLAAISVILMAAAACGGYSSPSTAPSPTSPSPSPPSSGPSSAVSIPRGAEFLGTRAFNPDDLDIAVGTTVTWTNTDSTSHTSTSEARSWDSGTILPGRQFSFTFQNAGTFPYRCTIHPGMVGTVVVR